MKRFFEILCFGVLAYIGYSLFRFVNHAEAWQTVDIRLHWGVFPDVVYWIGGAWLWLASLVAVFAGVGIALYCMMEDRH